MAKYARDVVKTAKPEWKKILLSSTTKPLFDRVLQSIDEYLAKRNITMEIMDRYGLDKFIRPVHKKIFNAFAYFPPDSLKVIIIGQDPYPNEDCQGLSFSTNGRMSTSLRSVYECLGIKREDGNLETWARNGVLLLNRNLTRSPDWSILNGEVKINGEGDSSTKYLHNFWEDYTNAIVNEITANLNHRVVLMLWGNIAQKTTYKESANLLVLKSRHPTEYTLKKDDPNHFVNSDQFKKAKEWLGMDPFAFEMADIAAGKMEESGNKINTDEIIVAGTDGGCPNNGKPGCVATYAAYFPPKFNGKINPLGEHSIKGIVPERIITMDRNLELRLTDKYAAPTNNRGEQLGAIYALRHILLNFRTMKKRYPVILVQDSEYVMKGICCRIWKHEKKNKNLSSMTLNNDLWIILRDLLVMLREEYGGNLIHDCQMSEKPTDPPPTWCYLTVLWQESHLSEKDIKKDQLSLDKFHVNQKADSLSVLN